MVLDSLASLPHPSSRPQKEVLNLFKSWAYRRVNQSSAGNPLNCSSCEYVGNSSALVATEVLGLTYPEGQELSYLVASSQVRQNILGAYMVSAVPCRQQMGSVVPRTRCGSMWALQYLAEGEASHPPPLPPRPLRESPHPHPHPASPCLQPGFQARYTPHFFRPCAQPTLPFSVSLVDFYGNLAHSEQGSTCVVGNSLGAPASSRANISSLGSTEAVVGGLATFSQLSVQGEGRQWAHLVILSH